MDMRTNQTGRRGRLTRREFLALALAGAVSSCVPAAVTERADLSTVAVPTGTLLPSPTARPSPTPTPTPAVTPSPAASVTPSPAATASQTLAPSATPLPDVGAVVRARDPGVWQGEALDAHRIGQMLDHGLMALTGAADAVSAWRAHIAPEDRVAIKVNTIAGSAYWTHPLLVRVLVARLAAIGVPEAQITIFDRATHELEAAGYAINRDGPGVRCYGTDGDYPVEANLLGSPVGLSRILMDATALLNVPILKGHSISGMSFALKNHYGTFDRPGRYHGNITEALGELSLLPAIAERSRLVIGDPLNVCDSSWRQGVQRDALLISRDPVAHDAVGLQMLSEALTELGRSGAAAEDRAGAWLNHAQKIGLGLGASDDVQVVEIDTGGI